MTTEKETKKLELWQKYALALAGVLTALGLVIAAATGTLDKFKDMMDVLSTEQVEEEKQ